MIPPPLLLPCLQFEYRLLHLKCNSVSVDKYYLYLPVEFVCRYYLPDLDRSFNSRYVRIDKNQLNANAKVNRARIYKIRLHARIHIYNKM